MRVENRATKTSSSPDKDVRCSAKGDKMKTNKVIILPIQRRDIVDLLTGIDVIIMKDGTTRKFTGFPDDMKLEQLHYDSSTDSLNLIVSSEEFDEVPDWALIPRPMYESETTYSRQIKLIVSTKPRSSESR